MDAAFERTYSSAFGKLLGRLPTAEERERAYRLRELLGADLTEATWGVFLALDYHVSLYEEIPDKIKSLLDGAKATNISSEIAAQAAPKIAQAIEAGVQRQVQARVAQSQAVTTAWSALAPYMTMLALVACVVLGFLTFRANGAAQARYDAGWHDAMIYSVQHPDKFKSRAQTEARNSQ